MHAHAINFMTNRVAQALVDYHIILVECHGCCDLHVAKECVTTCVKHLTKNIILSDFMLWDNYIH